MKNGLKRMIFCVVITLCAFCASEKGQKVYAAESGYVKLGKLWSENKSKIYKKYDVTGDGIADKVKISFKRVGRDDGRLQIYVNGKSVYNYIARESLGWDVGLVCLKNGKTFFDICSTVVSDDIELHKLYTYYNGKLNVAYDFLDDYSKYATYYDMHVRKVKGNTIYTKTMIQFFTTGGFTSYNMKFVYKDGKFRRESNSFPIIYASTKNNKWTVNRKIKVYKKAGGKRIIYTLKKGDKIKINRVVYKGKKIYFQVKNKNGKGKTGYIPATMNYPGKRYYFKEAFYSG